MSVGSSSEAVTLPRKLTSQEIDVVRRVASLLSEEDGAQLLADLEVALVRRVADDGAMIEFELLGYERPRYRGQHAYPVEGTMRDSDGTALSVILHADELNRLLELEIIRWDSKKLHSPDWTTLQLY